MYTNIWFRGLKKRPIFAIILLAILPALFAVSFAEGKRTPKSVTITQQTAGRTTRFDQFELDVAYRKQSIEDARVIDLYETDRANICCVIFAKDIEMLTIVKDHFSKNSDDVFENFGITMIEDPNRYILILSERYTEESQYYLDGFWYPGGGDLDIKGYQYIVERETLKIVDFVKVG